MTRHAHLRRVIGGIILPWAVLTTAALGQETEARQGAVPRLGINLAGPADYASEQPFVDVFRLSRLWISQKEGEPWGKGPPLALDRHGWVTRLEPGCWAETLMCTLDPGRHYPAGTYTVLHDGEGTLETTGAASVVARSKGRLTLRVDPSRGGFFLSIRATNPENPVRNIRVLTPGAAASYRENPWRPDFLKRWRGMACLRFMDLMLTNDSAVTSWSERPTLEDATFTTRGVPLELLIDLANRLQADPWFCMPHRADDDYIRNFARMVKEKLDPKRRVHVEYSNEVWNGIFSQHAYAAERGKALGFAEKPWEAAWKFNAHRSVEIFRIWEQVFGGKDRLVRVLAAQAANAYVAEQIVSFHDAARHADALAIAPYISFNVAPDGNPKAEEVAGWSVDRVLDNLEKHALPASARWIRDNQKVARAHGLKLIAYEGGQHMVGIGGAVNNEALTRLLLAANMHPRLEEIYRRHFQTWQHEGGGLFCYFSSVGPWSKWGSWGMLQYTDDDPSRSPKFRALRDWARAIGQPWPGPAPGAGQRR